MDEMLPIFRLIVTSALFFSTLQNTVLIGKIGHEKRINSEEAVACVVLLWVLFAGTIAWIYEL